MRRPDLAGLARRVAASARCRRCAEHILIVAAMLALLVLLGETK